MNTIRKQNLAIAGAAALVFVLLFVLLSRPAERPQSSFEGKTSTFYTDESGTKAIYLILKEFLPSVERWMKPLQLLQSPDSGHPSSLLVMGPSRAVGQAEAARLDDWVRSGGQLIVAAQSPWLYEPIGPLDVGGEGSPAGSLEPQAYLSRHGFSFISTEAKPAEAEEYCDRFGTLLLGGGALGGGAYTARLGNQSVVKAAEKLVGSGRILVIADEQAWSNARLSRSANAAWLVAAVLSWGNGRLLIDEYHHGFQKSRSVFSLMISFLTSLWGLAFLQLALAGLLLLFARGRRFGRLAERPSERKQDPLERIEALAALLEAAGAKSFALQTIHHLLLRRLWQLRYGALEAKARGSIKRTILSRQSLPKNISQYLSLVRRQEKQGSLGEKELVRAARRAGEITQEYRHGRESAN